MNEMLKIKIRFYSIVVIVFLVIIFLLTCFYQINKYDRHPHFNAIEGIIAVRRIEKNDLDYLKMKDNLYLCKSGKSVELLTNEFASFSLVTSELNRTECDENNFKNTIVITKSGKKMRTNAGMFEVPEGRFYFVGLKEFE